MRRRKNGRLSRSARVPARANINAMPMSICRWLQIMLILLCYHFAYESLLRLKDAREAELPE